jgi:hypothetical protein
MKLRKCIIVLVGVIPALLLSAQAPRTAYFMDRAIVRTSLNPAFQTDKGYFALPVVGSTSLSFNTNGAAASDFLYPNNGKMYGFMSDAVDANEFLSKLKGEISLNVNLQTDIIATGWHTKKAFWTVGVAVKASVDINAPKDLFEYMKRGKEKSSYDISNLKAEARTYLELSLGYSRALNERLTVGARVKALPALGGLKLNVNELKANWEAQDPNQWGINSNAELYAAGFDLENEDGEDYIGKAKLPKKLAGFGGAIDLGVSYKLLNNLTLSGSIIDLGLISWSKSAYAKAETNFSFKGFEDDADETSAGDDLKDLGHFSSQGDKKFSSFLPTSVLVGAEYSLFNNRLGLGLLASARFNPYDVQTELVASANFRPARWFAATLSYSALHSDFKTCGFALNFSPTGINFFVGSDYIVTKISEDKAPPIQASNAYVGLSIWL